MNGSAPLTEDAINRFRIIHPTDKETRPLARRLHRYATATSLDQDPEGGSLAHEREMIRLEALKWKLGVERMMGSVKNLERQRTTYLARAEETVNRTELLKKTLEEEQGLLETRRRERDRMIKCDEIAAKISARGKNRQELDERIVTLRQSLEEHKAALKLYQETAQGRVDIFTQITDLVKNCRDLKLPIDPNATVPVVEEETEKMDVDEKAASTSASTSTSTTANNNGATSGSGSKLSSMSLPFQPTIGGSSSTTQATSGSSSSRPGPKSRSSTPPASAALPARPPTGPSSGSGSGSGAGSSSRAQTASSSRATPGSSSLPSRPSNLRNSSTTGRMTTSGGGSLEEGELGGDEDGELKDRGTKRGAEPDRTSGRNTRSRQ